MSLALRHSVLGLLVFGLSGLTAFAEEDKPTRLLYVAAPGIRNYLEYGGHGILIFDIDHGHKLVRRIALNSGLDDSGKPDNVKGICANALTKRLYITTTKTLTCVDLATEKVLWEKSYEGGTDRPSLSPDGKILYLPSFEKDHWNVVDAIDGSVVAKIEPKSGSHNTVYARDGKHAYLAGLKSPLLTVANTTTHTTEKTVGPFSAAIRPFTVNGASTLCFVNVNGLLGFEVGDLSTGKKIHRVEIEGYKQGPVKRHGCPSHGIGLTPDEKELWVVDAFNQQVHIFDSTVMPPKPVTSIKVREEPGWVTFTLRGDLGYPSTGEVIDVKTHKIVGALADENGQPVMSEKMLEIDLQDGRVVAAGDQFGVGRVVNP